MQQERASTIWGVSRNTFVLGWVSFFTDVASETIYPLLPLFLVNVLGAPKAVVGLIEGLAESTASLLKLVSGWLADKSGKNKWLVGIGYTASALTKPLLGWVTAPWQVLALRFADRAGKGVRTAPRDALITATATPQERGRAFGLHRTMDTAGAVLGPLLAVTLMALFQGNFVQVFWVAALPGLVGVWLVWSQVRDAPPRGPRRALPSFRWQAFSPRFKLFVLSALVFAVANSSNAFLILRVQDLGVSTTLVPVAYLIYNVVFVLSALPAGILSDRLGRPVLLVAGYLAFVLVYLGFGLASAAWQGWLLMAGYGLFSGLTEGVERAWVGDLAPPEWRGSAFGVYHLAVGLGLLPASLLAGGLWDQFGPEVAFLTDAGLAVVAIGLFLLSLRYPDQHAAL